MKASLQTRLGQQLTLSPQMRLAIRLLQMSSVELEAEINAALESNPLLELAEPSISTDAADEPESAPDDMHEAAFEASPDEGFDDGRDGGPDDGPWTGSSGAGESDDDSRMVAASVDLHAHLLWQLQLSPLGPRDQQIGQTLIDLINDDGYLEADIAAVQASLGPDLPADGDEIEAVLHLIQHFDPVGVGARNLSECLRVQLGLLSPDSPGWALAQRLCRDHLDTLAKLGPERLAAQLGESREAMQTALALVRSLDPRPGSRISTSEPEFIAPDAITWRRAGVWQVRLARDSQPHLAVNRRYQSLIGKANREDDHYLRGQLQEARWLLKSLETRADTLLRVASAIVRQQSGFLEHGPEAMRPLTLRTLAEELGLHESTISRATTRKFLRTPRGTFEFKYFFSSGIGTEHGGAASATAISAMLRKLIDAEDPRHPLSDARLAALLKHEGIPVARRTVAKYREAMNISASNDRQRLG